MYEYKWVNLWENAKWIHSQKHDNGVGGKIKYVVRIIFWNGEILTNK